MGCHCGAGGCHGGAGDDGCHGDAGGCHGGAGSSLGGVGGGAYVCAGGCHGGGVNRFVNRSLDQIYSIPFFSTLDLELLPSGVVIEL